MELNLEIAAIIILIITNIAAVFFVKKRSSSIIAISLLIFSLIALNSLVFVDNTAFLKISVALVAFLIVVNHLFLHEFSNDESAFLNSKVSKKLAIILPAIFAILFFVLLYLGSQNIENISNNKEVSVKKYESLAKDKSNLLMLRYIKVQKIKKTVKDSAVINNLTLIVLLSTFLPLILLSRENQNPKNI